MTPITYIRFFFKSTSSTSSSTASPSAFACTLALFIRRVSLSVLLVTHHVADVMVMQEATMPMHMPNAV